MGNSHYLRRACRPAQVLQSVRHTYVYITCTTVCNNCTTAIMEIKRPSGTLQIILLVYCVINAVSRPNRPVDVSTHFVSAFQHLKSKPLVFMLLVSRTSSDQLAL